MKRKHLLWAAPVALLLVLAALALALPGFVASPAHRVFVQNFASRLIGRQVQINGKLSLVYLPNLELTATRITISGQDREVITARALALDLAWAPLLRGQLAVQTLNLDAADISFPWPLPGGVHAITPPPWLAALHAHLDNARIRFGAAQFSGVNADLFTSPGGSASISGSGTLAGLPVSLSLAVGQMADDGEAPLSLETGTAGADAKFSGTLDGQSRLAGQLNFTLPAHIAGQASITADGAGLAASALSVTQGAAKLSGTASLGFTNPGLEAELTGQGLDLGQVRQMAGFWPDWLPARVNLTAAQLSLNGHSFPALQLTLTRRGGTTALRDMTIGLPGGASLTGDVTDTHGSLAGHLALAAPDLSALASAYQLPAETAWPSANLSADLAGTADAPALRNLTGMLGPDRADGELLLSPGHLAYQLRFSHLDLPPLLAWLRQLPAGDSFTAEGELTASSAEAGKLHMENLFVDSVLDGSINIRRLTARLQSGTQDGKPAYAGLAAGSAMLDRNLNVATAHAVLDLPQAGALAALLPAGFTLPAKLQTARLTLNAAAAGPPQALAASAVATLGGFTLTASPVINLTNLSATGALSLRHPDAFAALSLLGLAQGCDRAATPDGYPFHSPAAPCPAALQAQAQSFPGPGALTLRARFSLAPNLYALNDFVLSLGALTAAGTLQDANNSLSGQIDAASLALPPIPASLQLPGSLPLTGKIGLNAAQVLYAGTPILGPTSATLTLAANDATLALGSAEIGHGKLSGSLEAKLSPGAAPSLSAKLLAETIDASALTLPEAFPLSLGAGRISATASLTASGYTAKAWAATLGGSATLTAANGTLQGFSLPDLITALKAPHSTAHLEKSLTSGTTPFTSLSLAGTIAQGNCTLTQASLTAPSGSLTATGGVDLYDSTLTIRLDAQPRLTPPLTLTTRLLGPWAKPHQTFELRAAEGWKAGAK